MASCIREGKFWRYIKLLLCSIGIIITFDLLGSTTEEPPQKMSSPEFSVQPQREKPEPMVRKKRSKRNFIRTLFNIILTFLSFLLFIGILFWYIVDYYGIAFFAYYLFPGALGAMGLGAVILLLIWLIGSVSRIFRKRWLFERRERFK